MKGTMTQVQEREALVVRAGRRVLCSMFYVALGAIVISTGDCSGRDAAPVMRVAKTPAPHEPPAERGGSLPNDLNLIVITIDTLRADLLGHPRHVVPNLDALAAGGVIFENAYSPASYTGKSVGPVFIGKHSSETHRDFSHFSAFAKGKDTFVQQRLQAAKIRTISVQGYWYFYQPKYGFEQGFDVVDSGASTGAGYVTGDRSTNSEKLADAVLAQLAKPENHDQRFYLWSHFTDPHAEYVSHAGFDFGSSQKERYYGEAAFVDHNIGRIIDWVRQQPWGKKTAIIVTSDHGEAFGEHGMTGHGGELWEPLIRVPLVFNGPGIGVRRITSRRSIIDLVPTILDLMQVPQPSNQGTDFVSGQSLLPELLGIEGSDAARPLFVDMATGPFNSERQAYISRDLKLVVSQDRPLGLFDLSIDPEERRNLRDNRSRKDPIVAQYRAFKKTLRVVEVKGGH
jgi:arylsulfatase A-like enzyme